MVAGNVLLGREEDSCWATSVAGSATVLLEDSGSEGAFVVETVEVASGSWNSGARPQLSATVVDPEGIETMPRPAGPVSGGRACVVVGRINNVDSETGRKGIPVVPSSDEGEQSRSQEFVLLLLKSVEVVVVVPDRKDRRSRTAAAE